MIRSIAGFAAAGLALAAMGMAAPHMREHTHGTPRYQPHEVEAAKESIALSLLGQLQLSVGDLMWLKSMEYLHMGVVQRMPTRAEEEKGMRRRDSLDAAQGLAHTEGVNMVLDSERDWRGIFGAVERNVKPYSSAHKHDDPVELIPWYQLAVRLNPSLERLYTLGAFYLADFAHAPGEAVEMLEAGIEANPFSFEIHAALGRLYVDYAERLDELEHHHHHDEHDEEHHDDDEHGRDDQGHDEHDHHDIHTPEEAYTEAEELLARAVELADAQRKQMAANREVFDDFQNQVFGESYLYLSKARMALSNFEGALEAASTGYETVSQYKQRGLLAAQGRVARRALEGAAAESGDLEALARARVFSAGESLPEFDDRPSNADWVEGPSLPVSVLAGIVPPAALDSIPVDEAALRPVLMDVFEHPYETPESRAARLALSPEETLARLSQLEALRFVAAHGPESSPMHALLPPGLYVARGRYGFDFWQAMEREARALTDQGVSVDLVADAEKIGR